MQLRPRYMMRSLPGGVFQAALFLPSNSPLLAVLGKPAKGGFLSSINHGGSTAIMQSCECALTRRLRWAALACANRLRCTLPCRSPTTTLPVAYLVRGESSLGMLSPTGSCDLEGVQL